MNSHCVRCSQSPSALMSYNYGERQIWIADLAPDADAHGGYLMCERHAGRITPPVGWTLSDLRNPVRPLFLTLEVA